MIDVTMPNGKLANRIVNNNSEFPIMEFLTSFLNCLSSTLCALEQVGATQDYAQNARHCISNYSYMTRLSRKRRGKYRIPATCSASLKLLGRLMWPNSQHDQSLGHNLDAEYEQSGSCSVRIHVLVSVARAVILLGLGTWFSAPAATFGLPVRAAGNSNNSSGVYAKGEI